MPNDNRPIDVWRDPEGVRMALEEIFEEDFARARIQCESSGANAETLARMENRVPARTLAWGYYRFAEYLQHLDALKSAGILPVERDLAAFEAEGLLALDRARSAFEGRHPACGSCGARQQNRFGRECPECGIKFQRKG
jgi:hypothetical protein